MTAIAYIGIIVVIIAVAFMLLLVWALCKIRAIQDDQDGTRG